MSRAIYYYSAFGLSPGFRIDCKRDLKNAFDINKYLHNCEPYLYVLYSLSICDHACYPLEEVLYETFEVKDSKLNWQTITK